MPNERTMRARTWRALATLCVAASAVLLLAGSPGPHVSSLEGAVEIGSGTPTSFRPAQLGEALAPGDLVRTGAGARAEVQLPGRTLRLYEHSLLRLPDGPTALGTADDGDEVSLERGRSLFDVLRGSRPFRVRTPEVVVSVKGTRFLVAAAGASAGGVSVFRGLVEVQGALTRMAPDLSVLVRPGFSAVPGAEGPLELLMHDQVDPWDAWSQGAQPPVLPQTEPMAAAQQALEAAIVREISVLDPDLVAPAPEPKSVPTVATEHTPTEKPGNATLANDVADTPALEPTPAELRKRRGLERALPAALAEPLGDETAERGAVLRRELRANHLERVQAMEGRTLEPPQAATQLDPVADVARHGASRPRAGGPGPRTSAPMLQALAGATDSGIAGASGPAISVNVAGGGQFVVLRVGSKSMALNQSQLQAIQGGQVQGMQPFLNALEQMGIDPQQMAGQLEGMLP